MHSPRPKPEGPKLSSIPSSARTKACAPSHHRTALGRPAPPARQKPLPARGPRAARGRRLPRRAANASRTRRERVANASRTRHERVANASWRRRACPFTPAAGAPCAAGARAVGAARTRCGRRPSRAPRRSNPRVVSRTCPGSVVSPSPRRAPGAATRREDGAAARERERDRARASERGRHQTRENKTRARDARGGTRTEREPQPVCASGRCQSRPGRGPSSRTRSPVGARRRARAAPIGPKRHATSDDLRRATRAGALAPNRSRRRGDGGAPRCRRRRARLRTRAATAARRRCPTRRRRERAGMSSFLRVTVLVPRRARPPRAAPPLAHSVGGDERSRAVRRSTGGPSGFDRRGDGKRPSLARTRTRRRLEPWHLGGEEQRRAAVDVARLERRAEREEERRLARRTVRSTNGRGASRHIRGRRRRRRRGVVVVVCRCPAVGGGGGGARDNGARVGPAAGERRTTVVVVGRHSGR